MVRGVILLTESDGPIATDGGFTASSAQARVRGVLKTAGIAVYDSRADAERAGVYAHTLMIEVSSLHISETYFYPWSMQVSLLDITKLADGSTGAVTVWSKSNHGYGGAKVVVDQAVGALDNMVSAFAQAVLKAQQKY